MFNIIVQMIKNLLLKNTKTTKMTMMLLATRDDEDDSYGSRNTRNHIEAKHIQSGGFQCLLCNAFSPTRHALKMHILRKHRKNWNWVVIFSPEWCHKSEDLQDWGWLIQLLWVWLLLEVQDNVPRPRREPPYFYCWVPLSLLPKILPYKKCSKITHFQKP